MELAFTKSVEEVCAHFSVDENVGLTDDQVRRALEKYGKNGE